MTEQQSPGGGFVPEDGQRPSDLVRDRLPDAPIGVTTPPTQDQVLEALKEVIDPELMVNVVDLGLVYGVEIDEEANVVIDMTLTSPACPLTDQLEWGAQSALDGIVNSVTINWVWLPPWSLDRITDDGREQLRYIGFNV
ncbi:metal-sulfur cluster assembly factor [uncultured Propionibacterium sp.]|uniref:metal-sulfur cluster assembly factor n=1 Tax=uncultured Propionibacterium sp. TaxID=218066 RepID=UPI00292DCF6A|nr:metal-sulfur cluster assembly factor [uncultured Propionibacterium sp.]